MGNFGPLVKANLPEIWFPPSRGNGFPEYRKTYLNFFFFGNDFLAGFSQSITAKIFGGIFGGIGKTYFPKNGIPPAGRNYFSENL